MGLSAELSSALQALLGDRLSTAEVVRKHHGEAEGWFPNMPPDAVCTPTSTDEVSRIVRLCASHATPMIPFGSGTSLEGHVMAVRGGVCIDLTSMNRILQVNEQDLDCRVEAGVTRSQLNEHLRFSGLMFSVDPGADATLGGMAATGASGTTTVRYGTMADNVLGLTVVTPAGVVIRTGGRARKSSAGYDLNRLFVGSEGTLGIVTELQLRLFGIPEAISAAVCQYPNLEAAVGTAVPILQLGVPVARIELLDEVQMQACIRHANLTELAAKPTLFFEFHGTPASVREHAETVQALSDEAGGDEFRWATRTEERNRLWKARHDAYFAALALAPGKRAMVTDACVPLSRLSDCILETKVDIQTAGMIAPIVGHVGDGNFHVCLLCDPDDSAEISRAKEINDRLVRRAIAMGGTCTGEHGVGYGKRDYLVAEHGDAIKLMRAVKNALDPDGLMNPEKILLS